MAHYWSPTSLATPLEGVSASYRFTGQREGAALGLYFYNARWYDPALGHFLSPDPLPPVPGGCPHTGGTGGA